MKSLSYDPAKDVFITKDGEYVADTVKPKVQLSTEMVIIPEAQKETVDLLTKLKNLMDKQNKPKEVERPVVEEEKKDEEKNCKYFVGSLYIGQSVYRLWKRRNKENRKLNNWCTNDGRS